MPQFDPTYFASQFLWLAVAFALLYFLLNRLILPKIGSILEERAERHETLVTIRKVIDDPEQFQRLGQGVRPWWHAHDPPDDMVRLIAATLARQGVGAR